jgi:hypothetical protein
MIRLIYISRTDNITFEKNKDILTSSCSFNQENKISGALVYGFGFFVQCLEGDNTKVRELYEKISQDARHYDVKLVCETSIDERHFSQWHMSLMNLAAYKSITDQTDFNPYEMDCDQLLALIDHISMIV